MKYTRKQLQTLLIDNNITTTAKSIIGLMLIALDNNILKREDVVEPPKEPKTSKEPPKPRGRPRKYPPKEVDPNKVVDPKYYRLRTIRNNPSSIKLTNVATGEATTYGSFYKAARATHHGCGFFVRHNGKVVDGVLIEVSE